MEDLAKQNQNTSNTDSLAFQDGEGHLGEKKFSLDIKRLILLFLMSLVLCTFGPFVLFTPVILSVAFIKYGRKSFLICAAISIVLVFIISMKYPVLAPSGGLFLISVLYSTLVGEMIVHNFHPQKIVLYGGSAIVLTILFFSVIFFSLSEITFTQAVSNLVNISLETIKASAGGQISKIGNEARLMQDIFNHPEKLVIEIKNWVIPFLFTGVFLSFWISLLFLLRVAFSWRPYRNYPYGMEDLIHYKTPFIMVYPLIIGLGLLLIGPISGIPLDIIGGNIVYCLGVFYFFQGFGVLSDLLTHLNIFGIWRIFLASVFIVLASKMIAFLGIFDVWINFRKFFKNKNKNKGDMA